MKMPKAGRVGAPDLLLVGGVVQFGPGEVANMLAADEMRVVPPSEQLSNHWPRILALTEDREGKEMSNSTDEWWRASQCGAEGLRAAPASQLADEALAEWIAYFARGADL